MRIVRLLSAAIVAAAVVLVPVVPASALGILIVLGPNLVTLPQTSASFTYQFLDTGDTGDDVECSLNGGEYEPCPSGHTVSGLSDGTHSIHSPDTIGATMTWTVDTSGPVVSIEPVADYVTAVPSITFSATDLSSIPGYWCEDHMVQPNGVTPYVSSATCSSPQINVISPWDGVHTFVVRATDQWGHSGQASITFALDRLDPEVTIDSGPASPSGPNASFAFSAEDVLSNDFFVIPYASGVASVECALDDGPREACSGTASFSALPDGEHTFTVYAVDNAGNESSDSYTWTVDATAPVVTAATLDGYLQYAPAGLDWSVDDATAVMACSYLVQSSSGPVVDETCADPFPLADVEGLHELVLTATDGAGNVGSSTTTFTVDRTAPTVSWGATPSAFSNSPAAAFTVTASDPGMFAAGVGSFDCELDGETLTPCGVSVSLEGLGDGTHSLTISAVDRAGNTSVPISWDWVIDTTAPVITVDSAPDAYTNQTSATIQYSVDGAASVECTLDGDTVPCASPIELTGLEDGEHAVVIEAVDEAGNTQSASVEWTVDTVAPVVAFGDPPVTSGSTATFAFSVTEAEPALVSGAFTLAAASIQFFECSLDGDEFVPCTSPVTLTDLAVGGHRFAVRATDAAGNEGEAAVHEWVVRTAGGEDAGDGGSGGGAVGADDRGGALATTGSSIPGAGLLGTAALAVLGGALLVWRRRTAA